MKLIDADAIVKFIENGMNNPNRDEAFGSDAAEILAEIMIAPTINPDDCRPHGRWIERKYAWFLYRCNLCRGSSDCESNYCPNCGAKMNGKENE